MRGGFDSHQKEIDLPQFSISTSAVVSVFYFHFQGPSSLGHNSFKQRRGIPLWQCSDISWSSNLLMGAGIILSCCFDVTAHCSSSVVYIQFLHRDIELPKAEILEQSINSILNSMQCPAALPHVPSITTNALVVSESTRK